MCVPIVQCTLCRPRLKFPYLGTGLQQPLLCSSSVADRPYKHLLTTTFDTKFQPTSQNYSFTIP
jgi:hypothetical protein